MNSSYWCMYKVDTNLMEVCVLFCMNCCVIVKYYCDRDTKSRPLVQPCHRVCQLFYATWYGCLHHLMMMMMMMMLISKELTGFNCYDLTRSKRPRLCYCRCGRPIMFVGIPYVPVYTVDSPACWHAEQVFVVDMPTLMLKSSMVGRWHEY